MLEKTTQLELMWYITFNCKIPDSTGIVDVIHLTLIKCTNENTI